MKKQNTQNNNAYFASSLRAKRSNLAFGLPRHYVLRNYRLTENGNALWFILIAIILLGLLTSMMTRSGGSTNDTGSYERNSITANEILTYTSSIENAVQSLLARGCSENDISFNGDTDGDGDYYDNEGDYVYRPNANSPTDYSCHLFHPNGAGLTLLSARDEDWLIDRSPAVWPRYNLLTSVPVDGLGSNTQGELLIFIPSLKKELCLAVNNIIGIANPGGDPPRDTTGRAAEGGYSPNFGGVSTLIDAPELNSSKVGCFVTDTQSSASSTYDGEDVYYFYHALIVR